MKFFYKLFVTVFVFFLFFISFKSNSFAAACNSSNYKGDVACIPSQISCAADGGTTVSGATCSSGQRCCCYSGSGTCTAKQSVKTIFSFCSAQRNTSGNLLNTRWGIRAVYYNTADGYSPTNPQTGPFTLYPGSSGGVTDPDCLGPGVDYPAINHAPTSNDFVKWFTACVDPTSSVRCAGSNCYGNNEDFPGVYYTPVSVICRAYSGNATYAGCGTTDYRTKNFGTVSPFALCPATSDYCTAAGYTLWPNTCKSGCGTGSNSCTYYKRNCVRTGNGNNIRPFPPDLNYYPSCDSTAFPNDSRCGSNCAISIPSPPTISSATPSCQSSTAAQVFVDWNNVTGATSYDIRYKRSVLGNSAWTSPTNVTNSQRTVTGLGFGTSYDF
ncbi:MAG: hypothetical protein UU21_C0019G0001, partial [Candidatus Levybacteria bacterium GW2011_GWA2_40_8]